MAQNEFNPYVGPRPFERMEEDSKRFFGRSQETQEIVSFIFGHPVTLVYAQSGAGKTSLFNASITLTLEKKGFDVLPLTRVGGVVPQGIALKEIKNLYIFNALLKIDSKTDPRTLISESLSEFLKRRSRPTSEDNKPRAIIFDQFEELFTYTPEDWREQRKGFFLQVVEALNADPLLRVVFVIREDFLAELDPYARDLPERLRIRYRLERLGENAALRAIKDPLVGTSRKFAPGVAEGLVKQLLATRTVDATGKTAEIEGQYVEPVQLQVVCVTLWSTLAPDVTEIKQEHLKNFNVNDALSEFYKTAVDDAARTTGVPEKNLRNWFGRTLITTMGTRSTVFRGEETTGGIENSAVDFLESRHIIRAEFRAGARWYELTHDRLVEPILKNNRDWFEKNLSLFQRQAELWKQQDHSRGLLLQGDDLAKAEEEAKNLTLSPEEQEFLDKCREQEQQVKEKLAQQTRERRRLWTFLAIASTLAAIAIVIGGFAFQQKNEAQRSANLAATAQIDAKVKQAAAENAQATAQFSADFASTQQAIAEVQRNDALAGSLAAQAESLKNNDHSLALLLSLEAYKRKDDILTRGTLFQLVQFTPYTRLFGFNGSVSSIVVSPDGKWIAVADSNEITLIDAASHQTLTTLSGKEKNFGNVNSLAFNQDGTLLAAGGCVLGGCSSAVGQITLWNVNDPSNPERLSDFGGDYHKNPVKAVAFSPNSNLLASGGNDQRIILWNIAKPQSPEIKGLPLLGHSSFVNSLAFSPDGNTLISAGDDKTILLWNVTQPESVHQLRKPEQKHTAPVNAIAFSPDGKRLASAGDDNKVILWDWTPGSLQYVKTLEGHKGYVKSVAFYQIAFRGDDTFPILASAGFDNTIILWNGMTGEQLGQLNLHSRAVNTLVFAQKTDGTNSPYLLSGSGDHTIIQWDLSTFQPLGQPIPDMSPPADISQTALQDGVEAKAEGQQIQLTGRTEPLSGHTGAVNSIRFSPQTIDGRTILVSASNDQTVILWDVSDPQSADVFLKLEGFANPVIAAYFTEDYRHLITIENNHHTIQWTIQPLEWSNLACGAVKRNLTEDEWNQYFQGQPYDRAHKTCP